MNGHLLTLYLSFSILILRESLSLLTVNYILLNKLLLDHAHHLASKEGHYRCRLTETLTKEKDEQTFPMRSLKKEY